MGGRGASGVTRNRSRGVDSNDIIEEVSLMSLRRGEYGQSVDAAMGVLMDADEKYGTQLNDVHAAKMRSKEVMAYYSPEFDEMGINEAYLDTKKMNAAYDACAKSGWHPSRGKKSGVEATVAHEVGHKLTAQVAAKTNSESFDKAVTLIVNEARKKTKHRGVVQMASAISRYATTSNAETVAEAYADVYCNGKKAKSESKAIMSVVDGYLLT